MPNKFEELLDLLVNEEMDKANELFHEIVVEKSREIYENLIAEEADEEEEADESVEEDSEEEDESVEEETTLEIGGDETDDFVSDVGDADAMDGDFGGEEDPADELGGDMGGEEDLEDKVMDLEDALEELKAEFEALLADEQNEPEHNDGVDDPDFSSVDGEDDEEGEEADDEEGDEDDEEFEGSTVREYVEKVGNDWEKSGSMKTPGAVGSGKGDLAGQTSVDNGAGPVSSGKGKPTTGATAHNIATQGNKSAEGSNVGTKPAGKAGGLAGSVKGEFTKGVQKNLGSSSKSGFGDGAALSKVTGGKGSEGQGWGSGKGDKAGQTGAVNTKSVVDKQQ